MASHIGRFHTGRDIPPTDPVSRVPRMDATKCPSTSLRPSTRRDDATACDPPARREMIPDRDRSMCRPQPGRLIGLFVVSLAAFIVCVTLFSLGVGLAVFVVGLFVLVGCLVVAGWSSRMTKAAGVRRDRPARTHYPPPAGRFGSCDGWGIPSPGATCCTS